MSVITDFTAKVEADYADIKSDITNIQAGITGLNAQLAALQASPTLSTADAAALQQIVTDGAALASNVDTVSAEFPTPPAAPPA